MIMDIYELRKKLETRLNQLDTERIMIQNYLAVEELIDWCNFVKIENDTNGQESWWTVEIESIKVKNNNFYEAIREANRLARVESKKHLDILNKFKI